MNIWHDLQPELMRREEYTVFTANSMGSTAVLSFDGTAGLLCLDHLSDSNIGAPNNTGFLPRTCTPEGLPVETVLSDALFKLAGELSLEAIHKTGRS